MVALQTKKNCDHAHSRIKTQKHVLIKTITIMAAILRNMVIL